MLRGRAMQTRTICMGYEENPTLAHTRLTALSFFHSKEVQNNCENSERIRLTSSYHHVKIFLYSGTLAMCLSSFERIKLRIRHSSIVTFNVLFRIQKLRLRCWNDARQETQHYFPNLLDGGHTHRHSGKFAAICVIKRRESYLRRNKWGIFSTTVRSRYKYKLVIGQREQRQQNAIGMLLLHRTSQRKVQFSFFSSERLGAIAMI